MGKKMKFSTVKFEEYSGIRCINCGKDIAYIDKFIHECDQTVKV